MRFTVNGVACEKSLLFLCYEGKQCIVAAPVTFAEAITMSEELFDIVLGDDKSIELQTYDIPECGLGVIEPEAWEILLPGLKKVEIKVVDQKQRKRQALAAANAAGPSKVVAAPQKPQASVSAQKSTYADVPDTKPVVPSGRQAPRIHPSNQLHAASNAKPKVSASSQQVHLTSKSRESMKSGPSTSNKAQKKPVQPTPPQGKVEEFMEEDEIEEVPPPSKSPRKAKRLRVDSDVGLDEAQEKLSFKRSRQSAEEQEEVEADGLLENEPNDPQLPETLEPVDHRQIPVFSPKKEHFSNTSERAPSPSSANRNESPGLRVSPDRVLPPRQFDPGASFVMTISYDRGEGSEEAESSPFKTKSRHLVNKVLKVACVTLEVPEEDRERVNLYVYDTETEQYKMCPRDRTVGECGLTEGSQMWLLLDERDDSEFEE
ncbi:hypothetical protein PHLGIDRAFT_34681 [Phlebiopsis gigantea 11061_1 CR5-6]|uniref:Uncharacterized protein n=1 Tax=Phlebiopsis gigantea (strain 11061_1 CR5-6) TaxID=745531 RepID=A0A0C3S1L3_PHLG1|nr:hypothetical protein PHLGIDRAFT_34681 [Phlebiopsis gigantea 11061_1 CR5-6]